MKFLICIICVAIIFWLKSIYFKKIDEEEEKALSTPGRADFIRNNFSEVIDYLMQIPNSYIIFEHADYIKIGIDGEKEYIAIHTFSGGLLIGHIKWSSVQKEWKFSRRETSKHIIYELNKYLKKLC